MKVSSTTTGLRFTLTNGLAVSMLDHEHPDGTREFAVLDREGELIRLGGASEFGADTIAFATRDQILALVGVMEARDLVGARAAARAIVAFLEALAAE
jgi:hypothetical protein